jgi:hypothetical protein
MEREEMGITAVPTAQLLSLSYAGGFRCVCARDAGFSEGWLS